MKRQYTSRTAKTTKAVPLVPAAPAPTLPPEMMALAEVLAAYLIRANIRAVIVEPSRKAQPETVTQ